MAVIEGDAIRLGDVGTATNEWLAGWLKDHQTTVAWLDTNCSDILNVREGWDKQVLGTVLGSDVVTHLNAHNTVEKIYNTRVVAGGVAGIDKTLLERSFSRIAGHMPYFRNFTFKRWSDAAKTNLVAQYTGRLIVSYNLPFDNSPRVEFKLPTITNDMYASDVVAAEAAMLATLKAKTNQYDEGYWPFEKL